MNKYVNYSLAADADGALYDARCVCDMIDIVGTDGLVNMRRNRSTDDVVVDSTTTTCITCDIMY
jgi:hypothetical protein